MVSELGYLHNVPTSTSTKRKNAPAPTGMEVQTRDLHGVKASRPRAVKLDPKGIDALALTLAAKGDPNVPRDPHAVARAGAKNTARVLGREFGGQWIVDVAK